MEKYNLDDKGGLFKYLEKRPSKVVKSGDDIELKHFNYPGYLKSTVLESGESTLKVRLVDRVPDFAITPGDHVILHFKPSKDFFVFTAEISAKDKTDPLEATIKVSKIEKLKDLIKEKKHCFSCPAQVKIIGIQDNKFAVAKNISFGGVKINCAEDVMLEDVVDITVTLDKINKLSFKGRVVRKNKIGSFFEYGIEYMEMTESNSKLLTRTMYEFESMV